ncbi:MAG: hypothetical protein ACRD3E_02470 [Terriglobales bacterium]
MPLLKARPWYAAANSVRLTSICFVAIAIIATVDAFIVPVLGLGFLYLVPLALSAAFLSRWQLLLVAAICTAFWEGFSNLPYTQAWPLRDAFVFLAFSFVSLLVRDMVVFRRAASRRIEDLEHEIELLARAGEESDLLIHSVPAGIVKLSSDGKIVWCNRVCHDILSVAPGALNGQEIRSFLPDIGKLPFNGAASTEMPGQRANGGTFRARVWNAQLPGASARDILVIVDLSEADAGKRQ